jgi:polyisoprenoid-binding protein YceI
VPAEPKVYTVDPARSTLVVQLFKTGIGGPLAHDHVVHATQYTGQIQVDLTDPTRSIVTIEVHTAALQADAPALRQQYGLTKALSEKDRQEVQAHMQGAGQLDVARYPTIQFRSTKITQQADGQYIVTGDLTLHGVTQSVTFPVQGEVQAGLLHGRGSFRLLQSRFGYKPYSAFLGAIKNQDEVLLHFDIVAVP